ncbi:hypothetical protein R7D97_16275 [Vibrio sp. Vb5031]|nr:MULTISPECIES: hypothetical protein [Vibrio]MCA2421882.1 hypothetical protein [Vibrio alginolyticus]MCA2446510.1 hypothetical protein [Vibrio alginolyticus]MCR9821556.1 hypothetical protein [Vibrio parahaemolyticus]MDF5108361.1 hypothetical protein [Vibrio parahaemolyticus]MDF5143267.1 hypothetical protein [Vibrio parahaemolyticus]
MSIKTVIEKMKEHAESVNLPKFYKEDLDIDFSNLKKYGNREYVWMLRECGSLLLPLRIGASPFLLEYYMRQDSTARFFHVKGYDEVTFKELKHKDVESLICKPPIEFGLILNSDDLIAKVRKVLNDRNVASSGLVTKEIPTTPTHWSEWLSFFNGNNDVMTQVMTRAIKMLNEFSSRPRLSRVA